MTFMGQQCIYMYSQADPFEYTITRVDINGNEINAESHSSSLSDTPFDKLTIHHLYDQTRPYFFFWDNRGVVKVKALQLSDYQLNPLAVHVQAFSTPGSSQPFWKSAGFVK